MFNGMVFMCPKLHFSRSIIKLSMISKNHLQPFLSAFLWIFQYHFEQFLACKLFEIPNPV